MVYSGILMETIWISVMISIVFFRREVIEKYGFIVILN